MFPPSNHFLFDFSRKFSEETNHTHGEKEKSPDTTPGSFNTLFKLYRQGHNAQRETEYPI